MELGIEASGSGRKGGMPQFIRKEVGEVWIEGQAVASQVLPDGKCLAGTLTDHTLKVSLDSKEEVDIVGHMTQL